MPVTFVEARTMPKCGMLIRIKPLMIVAVKNMLESGFFTVQPLIE